MVLVPCWIIQGYNQHHNKEIVSLSGVEITSVSFSHPPIKMWIVWPGHPPLLHIIFCIWMTGNSQLLTETSLSLLGVQAIMPLHTNYNFLFVIAASFRQTWFAEDIRMNHYPWCNGSPELSRGNWAKIREERVLRKTKRITLLDDVRTPAVCCLHFPIFIHLPKASNDFYEVVYILIRLAGNNNLMLLDLMLMTLKSNAALTIAFVIHVLTHSLTLQSSHLSFICSLTH